MEFDTLQKAANGSRKPKVKGWDIQPGVGKNACTQFEVTLPDASQTKDPVEDHKLRIILRAGDGIEWGASMTLDSNLVIVPAQQGQLAELFSALCAACQSRFVSAKLQLRAESSGGQACAAPFCEVGDTCRASYQGWSILLPDNILKHPKSATWGGIQDAWRNYKNLKESKKRASVLPPVVTMDAPRVHGSMIRVAHSDKPDGSAINPVRLIQKKRYAAISYTWSQVSKQELLENATSRAKELGYEYIWIDQYCIDQNNQQERMPR
ncbi:hypothetical protein BDW66DRAFT_160919 [Aspergillus desertorum]